jgi:6-pyruvoyltetrahydropterin/6-carboxytetrahydropterin synthase
MFRVEKLFRFEASHRLPNHDGKCARLHGHSWVGRLVVEGDALQTDGPKAGMLADYGDLSAAIAPLLLRELDHHHLNDSTGLPDPTSEALARYVFDRVAPLLPGLSAVVIEETCTSRAEYRP